MRRISKIVSFVALIAMLLLPVLFAPGCSNSSKETASAFSVTDDRGVTLSFDEPVDSIISLAPSNTEIVFFVGAGDKLIGRTDYCNFPAEVSSIESIGGYSGADKERVVILNPDVVLATHMHVSNGDVDWLEDHGLTVVVLDPESLEDILNNILLVGKLTGNEDQTKQKVAGLQARVKYITDRTAVLSEGQKPRVLHVTWHDPLWTVGQGSFLNAVIGMAGGTNIFSNVAENAQVDVEQAVTRNPQVITVVTGHGSAMTYSYDYIVAVDSPFKETDAFKDDRVFMINADIATRPGPRIVEALELFAKFLHPEIFP